MRKFLLLIVSLFLTSASNKLDEGMSIPKFFARVYNESASGYGVVRSDNLFNGKNKAVVVSFFASYCKPCKKEIFVLNDFYNKYRDKGVMIVEISIDLEKEGMDLFKSIVDDSKLTIPCVIDSMGVISRRFGVERLPTLFVFDKYGYVKKRFEGYTEESIRDFEKVVLDLISDEKVKIDEKMTPQDGGYEVGTSRKKDSKKKDGVK